MLKYTEDNFWYVQYDAYGSKLLEKIDRKGKILLFTFTFFTQGAVFTYMLAPLVGIFNLHRLIENEILKKKKKSFMFQ